MKTPKEREQPELRLGHAAFHPYPGVINADEILRIIRAQKNAERLLAKLSRRGKRRR